MSTAEYILTGALLSTISALFGSWVSTRGKVDCRTCLERRTACIELIDEKLSSLEGKIDILIGKFKVGR